MGNLGQTGLKQGMWDAPDWPTPVGVASHDDGRGLKDRKKTLRVLQPQRGRIGAVGRPQRHRDACRGTWRAPQSYTFS